MGLRVLSSLFVLLALLAAPRLAAAGGTIKPGDKLGQMVVTNGRGDALGLSSYCSGQTDCVVPQVDRLAIGNAWDAASQQVLENNWAAMDWTITLDGQQIDLASFGTVDSDRLRPELGAGVVTRSRAWDVVLVNPTPGLHPIHVQLHMLTDINDGFSNYPSAVYDFDFDFTVEGAQPTTVPRTGSPADQLTPLIAIFGAILVAAGLVLRRRLDVVGAQTHKEGHRPHAGDGLFVSLARSSG